jgi:hypothetical protein
MQAQPTTTAHIAADPFALMMNPQAVLDAMASSTRLAHLQRRVYRPLDKPLIPHRNAELAAFDSAIDEDPADDDLGADDSAE